MEIAKMKSKAQQASSLLAAMSNEKRLMILCRLLEDECSVNDLADLLKTRQSTVSQHLALLRKDGLVRSRRVGQTQFYSLIGHEARLVLETLYGIYCAPGKKSK